MLTGQKGVKYGLSVPASKAKAKPALQKPVKLAAFGDDSDDDHEAVPQQLARQAASKRSDSKVADMHAAALAADPSAFDYDGVYDSMQEQRAAPVLAKRQNRSSKYIESLLDKAEERKREQEIVFERRQVKEREVEDHLFGDKEKFVTAAYKAKLQERQLWEAEQALKDKRDEETAGQKLGHMGGFYGSLLTKNVAFGAKSKQPGKAEARASEPAAQPSDRRSGDAEQPASPAAAGRADGIDAQPSAAEQGTTQQQQDDQAQRSTDERQSDGGGTSQAATAQAAEGAKPTAAQQEAAKREAAAAAEKAAEAQRERAARHTDSAAAAAARERYLARKRKAGGQPDPA